MKRTTLFILLFSSAIYAENSDTYTLKIDVTGLRNAMGQVQFALYNKEDTIPDEKYKKYYIKHNGKIVNGSSSITFNDLPSGKYAVNILHDEDLDGEIDKGFVFPKEGIEFSNFSSIGLRNRPSFTKASFDLVKDMTKSIKIIYF